MRKLHFAATATIFLSAALAFILTSGVWGQDASDSGFNAPAVKKVVEAAEALAPKGWQVSRTEYGQPDISGFYTNVSLTPLVRHKDLGDEAIFTPQGAKDYVDAAIAARNGVRDSHGGADVFGVGREYDSNFLDSPLKLAPTLQTSLIVDPPDGQMPALMPEVKARLAEHAAMVKQMCADPTRVCPPGYDGRTPALADKPSDFSLMYRCIQWATSGPPMLPSVYDSNYHIVQNKNYVMIFTETIHNSRIIPIDGMPHLPDSIRQLSGDSRGHWEGNTLVVDTTNFSNMTDFRNAGRNLHIIERFTRVAPNVLLYEFTAEDPTTFTGPFTAVIPMTTIKGPIFEYACTEGNYALADVMRGARLEEKQRAEQGAENLSKGQENQPR